MAIIWRHSALAHRHAAIGGELEDWNGMGTAWFYDHTPERAKADYEAIRTKAGLMDVSGLKKLHVTGKDILDHRAHRVGPDARGIALAPAGHARVGRHFDQYPIAPAPTGGGRGRHDDIEIL